jgi:hypothetical protein
MAQEFLSYERIYFLVTHFKNKLDHIVTKGVLDKSIGMLGYLCNESFPLLGRAAIDTFLHNATAMLVADNFAAALHHGIEDELVPCRWPSHKDLLNHMISVYIFSQLSKPAA